MAWRSSGASGAAVPCGLPGRMSHQGGSNSARRYSAMVLKVWRTPPGAASFSARPPSPMAKSPSGLCAGLGTSHRCASRLLAAKRSTAAGAQTKSGAKMSPATTQKMSSARAASSGSARAMPPAVSSA